jgi:small subunit ribosomal protein S20
LANSAQAKKRARQAEKHRQHNVHIRSTMRTAIKKILAAIEAKDKDLATSAYKIAMPMIDRSARKGIIHANKAARYKHRLNNHIRNIA